MDIPWSGVVARTGQNRPRFKAIFMNQSRGKLVSPPIGFEPLKVRYKSQCAANELQ